MADVIDLSTPTDECAFRGMGSRCRVVVVGARGLARRGQDLVEMLESRWSRFDPQSEVSLLNDAAGRLVIASAETYALLAHAECARRRTEGRFNPLLLDQLCALGYDRSWEQGVTGRQSDLGGPADTDAQIELLEPVHGVEIPFGTRFDPGGIGKGLAADLVTADLLERGAHGVLVELGGDLRVAGRSWLAGGWRVDVADPFDPSREIGSFALDGGGAVATSSVLKKRWSGDGDEHHHLIDPATGRSAATDLVAVTVSAGETWWAEVCAKVVLMAGVERAVDLLDDLGVTGLAVGVDGSVVSNTVTVPAEVMT